MSAGRHHRVKPGAPDTEHEVGRRQARVERLRARSLNAPLKHLRLRDADAWAALSDEQRRGYEAGWRSTL